MQPLSAPFRGRTTTRTGLAPIRLRWRPSRGGSDAARLERVGIKEGNMTRPLASAAGCHEPQRAHFFLLFVFLAALSFGCGKSLEPYSPVMQHVSGSLVALSTPDAPATARWYQENLGFHLVKEGQMGKGLHFALLRYDDNILELIQSPEARP